MRDKVRYSWCAAVLALVSLAPNAFAQRRQVNNSPSNSLAGTYIASFSATDAVAVSLLQHYLDNSSDRKKDKTCKPDRRNNYCNQGSLVASEGGSPAAYFLLAGLACLGAIVFRFRRQIEPQKSV
jgi:hypothetical protein